MKSSITRQSPKRKKQRKQPKLTIGMDLGKRMSRDCVLGGWRRLGAWGGSALRWKWERFSVALRTSQNRNLK